MNEMQMTGHITLQVGPPELGIQTLELDSEEVEVRLQAKSGWTAAQGRHSVVVLSTDLTPELIREGFARDVVRLVQDTRKQQDLERTARIRIYLKLELPELSAAIEENLSYIIGETLAIGIVYADPPAGVEMQDATLAAEQVRLGIEVVKG